MNLIKVNLIGAGKVGQTFLRLLSALPKCQIQDVLSASDSSAHNAVQQVGSGRVVRHMSDLRLADLWIIAVPDAQIEAVAAEIAATRSPTEASIAFHCSGFYPADQMAPLRTLSWHLASVHPVMSFADPAAAANQFKGALCGLEGDASAVSFLRPVLEALGAECFSIRSESKSLYHAAAVISNNFTVVLQAIARDAWAQAGVSDDVAWQLNAKLLESTVENVVALGPQDALTGPAARGDQHVVATQCEDVAQWNPPVGELYRVLSDLARRLKTQGRTR